MEEEDEDDEQPASRSSLGKQQGKRGSSTGKGRGASAPKGPNTARGRKMKRISGGSSDEADDGSEGGQEDEEMEEEEEKVPVPRSRRSRGRGLPVSQLGEGADGAGSDQDVSLSSSDGGGSGDDADGDDDVEEDNKRSSKPSVKKVCQLGPGQLQHAL